jgi:flagellar motor switch protein FliN/FliY
MSDIENLNEERAILENAQPNRVMTEESPTLQQGSTVRSKNIDRLMDVLMRVTVELGRTNIPLSKVLELQKGSVIELEHLAGDPVDILVNDSLVARGEVVVVDDNFGVRITELVEANQKRTAE